MKKFSLKISWIILLMFGLISTYQTVNADTDTSLQKVQQKGEIVMGTAADYPPFEFKKTINGTTKMYGTDVMLGQRIAKDLGVKLKIKTMPFDSLIVGMQTGKIDMILAGMDNTPERAKNVNFSIDYYDDPNVIVATKDGKAYNNKTYLKGTSLGAQTGSMQYNLAKKQKNIDKLTGFETNNDIILALKSKKIDGAVMDKTRAKMFVQNDNALKLSKLEFSSGTKMAAAFPKKANELTKKANNIIKDVNEKKLYDNQFMTNSINVLNEEKSNKKDNFQIINKANSMWNYKGYFLSGMMYTIIISLVSTMVGFIIGLVLVLMRLSKSKLIKGIVISFVEFIRGTPLMVQIMFVYFGLGIFVNISAIIAGIIAISINSGAYIAEIIRGGINSIDTGQSEAARSLGISNKNTMRFIILPQALKNIWPALGNEFISLIKESSIVSIIGVTDLIYQLKIVQSDTYRGVMPIFIAMILYFLMTFTVSLFMKMAERKMSV